MKKPLILLLLACSFSLTSKSQNIFASLEISKPKLDSSVSVINTVDGGRMKQVCKWVNGCNDEKVCCKLVKGGEDCANTPFPDENGQQIPRCTTNQTSGCVQCIDLDPYTTKPIMNHNWASTNYNISYTASHAVRVTAFSDHRDIFNTTNYPLTSAGRAVWVKAVSNIVTVYTATYDPSASNSLGYTGTLDSVRVGLDTLFIYPLSEQQLDILRQKWMNESLTVTIAPNPSSGKFSISTQSTHSAVSATKELVLELYSVTGELLSTQSIAGNGKYDFIVPQNYSSEFIIYRINWVGARTTGKITVIKP
jgi:hypothetical protein